jgi:hypothetical protein
VIAIFGTRHEKTPTTVYFARADMERDHTMYTLAPTRQASRSISKMEMYNHLAVYVD